MIIDAATSLAEDTGSIPFGLVVVSLFAVTIPLARFHKRRTALVEEMLAQLIEVSLLLEDFKDRLWFLEGHVTANRSHLYSIGSPQLLCEAERVIASIEHSLKMLAIARSCDRRTFIAHFREVQSDERLFRKRADTPAPWEDRLEVLLQALGRHLASLDGFEGVHAPHNHRRLFPVEVCLQLAEVGEARAAPNSVDERRSTL